MTGVVLAGGQSTRMGRDKARLDYGGRPLILHQLEKLSRVFADVRISAKSASAFVDVPYPVIEDSEEISAPLIGIASALRAAARPIFALGVDLPRLPEVLIEAVAARFLGAGAPCVALHSGGKLQGLCAAYGPSMLPVLDRHVAGGNLSIYDVVTECGGVVEDETFWGPLAGAESFTNWNRPEDVAAPAR
jgi:molybdopterin-guanine dinucleotide biosynthesis protein A